MQLMMPPTYGADPLYAAAKMLEGFQQLDEDPQATIYQYIIDLGKKLLPTPDDFKQSNFLVKGCQSTTYLAFPFFDHEPDRLLMVGSSESDFVRGLVLILQRLTNGHKKTDIIEQNVYGRFFDKSGIFDSLSLVRQIGLGSMITSICLAASKKS